MLRPGNQHKCNLVSVLDGDTLELNFEGETFKARLQWIDSPETKKKSQNSTEPRIIEHWSYGDLAKTALINLLSTKPIIIIPVLLDIYSRWICDCYVEKVSLKTNVQVELCKLGMAVSYYLPTERYGYSDRELDILLNVIKQTALANRKKLGFWKSKEIIFPHNFRQLIKKTDKTLEVK